jgi:hypothetical protein
MLTILDAMSVFCGRVLAVLFVASGCLWLGCWLMDAIVKRTGHFGMMLSFVMAQAKRNPRTFWAQLFWGKSDANS